jgi:choline dehydrogenase-like flavoprotein
MGCPRHARASADNTYWPLALAAGARLITGAAVSRILVDGTGRATGAEWFDESRRVRRTTADVVIVAANGIGTPRILLNSTSAAFPDGVANSSGQVGRNLMLHPIAGVSGIWSERVDGWSGNDAFCLLTQHFYETDLSRGFSRGYEIQLTRSQGPMLTALGGFGLNVPWGEGHHARFEAVFGHAATAAVTCEDLPDERNFISLDASASDRFGVPAARMHYTVEDNAERMLDHGIASATTMLREAGAAEVLVTRVLPGAGFHLMGTARMGSDPATSVVNADGRTHDVPNLYIVDGSVFASAAAVNPTPTMQAIALRTADRILATAGVS